MVDNLVVELLKNFVILTIIGKISKKSADFFYSKNIDI